MINLFRFIPQIIAWIGRVTMLIQLVEAIRPIYDSVKRIINRTKGGTQMVDIIHDQPLGKVGTIDVKVEKAMLIVDTKLKIEVAGVAIDNIISLDACVVFDAIAKAIPGTVDDQIIGLIKSALKNLT